MEVYTQYLGTWRLRLPDGILRKPRLLQNLRNRKGLVFLSCLLLITAIGLPVFSQGRLIKGEVTEENHTRLPGVSILVKGTQQGTSTNANGEFSMQIAGDNPVLIFSFVGYITQEVALESRTEISVSMQPEVNMLKDVVVVGYGTQKKVNMTGSVATINSKDIENRPTTNLSSSLAGLAPGVSVQQGSGKPGSDGASIRIRGVGTLNNSSPLIIVDGIISSMDAVNPNDVESMSILKDAASASIYGSLAANGVILITTKKGVKGDKPLVSYSGLFSMSQPINTIKFVTDYARHMELINEGFTNLGQNALYAQTTIDAWRTASENPDGLTANGVPNRIAYPNTDWSEEIFKNKLVQNHNISVSGGSEKLGYLLSARYLNNPGTMDNTGAKLYQVRVNLQSKVNKFITLGTQTYASTESLGKANTDNAFNFLRQTSPGVYPILDGKYGFAQAPEESSTANNILVYLNTNGGSNKQSRFNTTMFATVDILTGLSLEARFNYQTRFLENNSFNIPFEKWNFATNTLKQAAATPDQLGTSYSFNKDYATTSDLVLRYNTDIGSNQRLGLIAGFNQYEFNYYETNASKRGLIDATITTLGSATEMTSIGGTEYDRAMKSYFGRINYSFKDKYLLEANMRYDGSSRFSSANRWGLFPSVSAGWKISDEPFLQELSNVFSSLKLRASWGKLGNNASGDYDYQSVYSTVGYSFNGTTATGLWQGKIPNANLKWETTTVSNIGLEGSILKHAVNFEIDIYRKYTDGILTTPPIQLALGTAGAPTQNTAAVLNKGLEVSLGWRGRGNSFQYGLVGNFAYNFNQVDSYKGVLKEGWEGTTYTSNLGDVSTGGDRRIVEGHPINEFYTYTVYSGTGGHNNNDGTLDINGGPKDGMIRTVQDMAWLEAMMAAGHAFLPAGGIGQSKIYYGDIIYADRNGDGIYGNVYDRKFQGVNSAPKYNFGLRGDVSWKGFDVSMLWSGSTGFSYLWNFTGYNNSTIQNGFSIPLNVADDHYYYNAANPNDPANNITGSAPRLKNTSDAQNAAVSSNYWLYKAGYIKLKNLQAGYTVPKQISQKLTIERARIYLSAENLLMITKYPGMDPEIGANVDYPTMLQYALGINLSF